MVDKRKTLNYQLKQLKDLYSKLFVLIKTIRISLFFAAQANNFMEKHKRNSFSEDTS